MTRRCEEPGCGARAADGADVRECDGCTFGVCEAHGDEGGKRRCEECKRIDEKEAAMNEKMPMPVTMDDDSVARWLIAMDEDSASWHHMARAVLALVEARVSVALHEVGRVRESLDDDEFAAIVARVMGKEADRG